MITGEKSYISAILKAKSRIIFPFKDNARTIMLYHRIGNDKGTNHANRLSGKLPSKVNAVVLLVLGRAI